MSYGVYGMWSYWPDWVLNPLCQGGIEVGLSQCSRDTSNPIALQWELHIYSFKFFLLHLISKIMCRSLLHRWRWPISWFKLNYIARQFLSFLCHEVCVSQTSAISILALELWLTTDHVLFAPSFHHQSQWRDCSGSNKSQGWERCSACGAPERADEGGVPGEGPAAEGKRGEVWPPQRSLVLLGCGSLFVGLEEGRLSLHSDTLVQLLWELTQVETDKMKH